MATPVKDTPAISGKDARLFVAKMNKATENPVPRKDYDRAMKTYLSAKDKFPFL